MPQHAGTASRSVASSTRDEDRDISLYDQLKLTAALAACVSEYLQQADAFSLLDTPAELRREPAFLLYTADFSRIQRFIYTVHTCRSAVSANSSSAGSSAAHYRKNGPPITQAVAAGARHHQSRNRMV